MRIRLLTLLLGLVAAALPAGSAYSAEPALALGALDAHVLEAELGTATFPFRVEPDDGRLEHLIEWRWQQTSGAGWTDVEGAHQQTVRRTDPAADFAPRLLAASSLPSGTTRLVLAVQLDGGARASATSEPFELDRAATGTATPSEHWVYPAPDGYLDDVTLDVQASEPVSVDVRIVEPGGPHVGQLTSGTPSTEHTLRWDGTGNDGQTLPAGYYVLGFTFTDATGQESSDGFWIELRPERLVWEEYVRHLTPATARKLSRRGPCSTLREDVNGWSGGHGLWSNTQCSRRSRLYSTVAVTYGSRLPTYGVHAYRNVRAIATGRADAARPRSTAQILRYVDGRLTATTMGARYGQYVSPATDAPTTYVDHVAVVQWRLRVVDGHRWDVRRFTVKAEIQVLR